MASFWVTFDGPNPLYHLFAHYSPQINFFFPLFPPVAARLMRMNLFAVNTKVLDPFVRVIQN